jgi:hypothetical protein
VAFFRRAAKRKAQSGEAAPRPRPRGAELGGATIGFWGMIHGDSFYGKTMGKWWFNGI